MKILYEATRVFSASLNASLHIPFHQLDPIHIALDKTILNLNTILAPTGCDMRQKYDKYWGNVDNINYLMYFGVILDPHYLLELVTWNFAAMYKCDPLKVV